jgi:hypothetical protein
MSLYYSLENTKVENTFDWRVGESSKFMNEHGKQCVEILANGNELEAIRKQFGDLVIPKNQRIVEFSSETAALIATNLK